MSRGVIFYGDPHGEWRPLLRACEENRPDGVVILGDCDLTLPLREQIRPVFDAGIRLRWIPGNHDVDLPEFHDRLWMDYPEGNLHARRCQMGDIMLAGLGGVFHERIWYPRGDQSLPEHASRQDFLRHLPRGDRWRGGLPLKRRAAIFPEDIEALDGLRVDVLVTHEAPSSHVHGFVGIDTAAKLCRAKLVVHGHHHTSADSFTADGIRVIGLAKAEVLRLAPGDVP